MIRQEDYVELGLAFVDVCTTLNEKLKGVMWENTSSFTREAIEQLTT